MDYFDPEFQLKTLFAELLLSFPPTHPPPGKAPYVYHPKCGFCPHEATMERVLTANLAAKNDPTLFDGAKAVLEANRYGADVFRSILVRLATELGRQDVLDYIAITNPST